MPHSTGANAAAGVSFSEDGDEVTVQVTSIDRADDIYIQIHNADLTDWVDANGDHEANAGDGVDWVIGSSVTMDSTDAAAADLDSNGDVGCGDDIERVTVIGELNGERTGINTWDP